ncbi:hypothetical protein HDU82_001806 [Entophlyctis luteolus]|nr:hypothetical protein HDU82_001806 [Entophlyctis luteolus]
MTAKVFCALSSDTNLTGFHVDFDVSLTVSDLKDAIRAKKMQDLGHLDADKLTLVRIWKGDVGGLTKRELKQSKEFLSLTAYGDDPEDGDDVVSPLRTARELVMNSMKKVSLFVASLPEELYHVLVLVPNKISPNNSLHSLNAMEVESIVWRPGTVNCHAYDIAEPLFELDSDYLTESGLPATKLVLYCRSIFHDQFKFIKDRVLIHSRLGWILGPPGTGKSTTTLAFVSVIPTYFPGWVTTWIHLSRSKYPVCVRFDGKSKESCVIEDTNISRLRAILNQVDGNHIVFVDGFAATGDKHIDVQKCCYDWRSKNLTNRRLVVVCSMSSRGKTKLDEDQMDGVEEFFVYSWKLDEYLSAVQHLKFVEVVKQNLDSSALLETLAPNGLDIPMLPEDMAISLSSEDMVISKFHFAGGSSRLMFHFNTATVISFLEESANAVGEVLVYLTGAVGDRSDSVINRLFGCYLNRGSRQTFIVSKYAATLLSIRQGPELILNIAHATQHDRNPSMDGWLLELWVFASLRKGGLRVYPGIDANPMLWAETDAIESLDLAEISLIPDSCTWWKPIKWNQGGYDAIVTNKRFGKITFIQIASGDVHSFKIQFFYMFLLAFAESRCSYRILELEIIFLVEKSKMKTFRIGQVSGQGLLHAFGWAKDKETSNVKIYDVDGLRP